MRFLADENFPVPSIHILRREGHDVVSIIEESPGIADDVILMRAVSESRIILTFDRDYGELIYRLHLIPASVLYLRYDPIHPQEPAQHILKLLSIPELDITDCFTVADRQRVRQRPLP